MSRDKTPDILVVDDTPANLQLISGMLRSHGYKVRPVSSAALALQAAKAAPPDLVLLDINMPEMDGYEVCTQLKASDKTREVPIIFLSALHETIDKVKAFNCGGVDYISKPFDAREMREVISRNVERTRLHRTSENAAGEIKELNNRLLQELAQKERLASLGQASAEFVHDIGNPLTIVWGYVQLLAKKLEESERIDDPNAVGSNKELEIIEQNVRLCRDLLTMWQSYGSVEAAPHKLISISEIVREVVASVGAMAKETPVELKVDVTEDPCSLVGDAVQITRAIQNVIINAIQASADNKGTVEVTCIRKDFYVDVRIADTGHGISSEQIAKIFDPYFTTKQGKSGTGLGLYITKKVVEDHSGSIKVDSTPEVGTTITIRLPLQGS